MKKTTKPKPLITELREKSKIIPDSIENFIIESVTERYPTSVRSRRICLEGMVKMYLKVAPKVEDYHRREVFIEALQSDREKDRVNFEIMEKEIQNLKTLINKRERLFFEYYDKL